MTDSSAISARPGPVVARAHLAIVRASESHADAVAAFYRATWDATATGEKVAAAWRAAAVVNPAFPEQPPPVFVAVRGGSVVGHLATVPARFWNGDGEVPGYWTKGLMVLPEYRNGPVGYLILREAAAQLRLLAAVVVAAPARRLFEATGFHDLGALTDFVRPLRPGRLLQKLDLARLSSREWPAWTARWMRRIQRSSVGAAIGAPLGGALRALAAAGRIGSGRLNPRSGLGAGADVDELWRATRAAIGAGAVRDARCLRCRYAGPASGGTYEIVRIQAGREAVAALVVRRPSAAADPRLHGVRVATVADLLVAPGDRRGALAALGAAERIARTLGADALLCSTSQPWLGRLLRRQAYVSVGASAHCLIRDADWDTRAWPRSLAAWWVLRGDARSDDAF